MKFKVGDVVVGHSFVNWPEYNGMEGTVIDGPVERTDYDRRDPARFMRTRVCCRIAWANGNVDWPCVKTLRLKRSPSDFTPADEDFCEWLKAQRREKA
jgi:hypothetical protein